MKTLELAPNYWNDRDFLAGGCGTARVARPKSRPQASRVSAGESSTQLLLSLHKQVLCSVKHTMQLLDGMLEDYDSGSARLLYLDLALKGRKGEVTTAALGIMPFNCMIALQ